MVAIRPAGPGLLISLAIMKALYRLHYAPDNASLVIRLALEELHQPYRAVLVNRAERAQKSPDYLALNPNGLIPALETPDGPIFETAAILLWLGDRHGRLTPEPDSRDRAAFLKWLFFLSNTLHPALRMIFYPEQYVGHDRASQSQLRSHMPGEICRYLDMLEGAASQKRAWLAGETPSALDLYIAPMLRWVSLYPLPKGEAGWFRLENWPHLHDMAARLEHCQSVQAAIQAEGLGPHPFTAPIHPNPPEGSAT